MRVLFTSVPEPPSAAESAEAWLPLSLVHLAGSVRADGHECQIVDALSLGLRTEDVERIVREANPDVVCVTAATPGFPAALDLCRRVRAEGRTTIIGGVHASYMFPEFLPAGDVDFVVVGEGEETLPELLRCLATGADPARVSGIAFALAGRVVRTAPRPRLAALDPLPKAWDLLSGLRYRWAGRPGSRMGAIATSRGCPRRCGSCCQSAPFDGSWRGRSIDSVAYELTKLRREHGVDLVGFYDPSPAADARRFTGLTDRLMELDLGLELVIWASVGDILRDESVLARWRSAGVIHVGICRDPAEDRLPAPETERAVSAGRRAVQALRRAGIGTEASFWLGFPDETPASVDQALSRALAWDPDVAHFPLLTPLPYTPAWRIYGAHVITRDYRRYNLREPVVKPRDMELHEVVEAADRCRMKFLEARPLRYPASEARRAGPWLVHPVEPATSEPVPDEPRGGEPTAIAPVRPVPRN